MYTIKISFIHVHRTGSHTSDHIWSESEQKPNKTNTHTVFFYLLYLSRVLITSYRRLNTTHAYVSIEGNEYYIQIVVDITHKAYQFWVYTRKKEEALFPMPHFYIFDSFCELRWIIWLVIMLFVVSLVSHIFTLLCRLLFCSITKTTTAKMCEYQRNIKLVLLLYISFFFLWIII